MKKALLMLLAALALATAGCQRENPTPETTENPTPDTPTLAQTQWTGRHYNQYTEDGVTGDIYLDVDLSFTNDTAVDLIMDLMIAITGTSYQTSMQSQETGTYTFDGTNGSMTLTGYDEDEGEYYEETYSFRYNEADTTLVLIPHDPDFEEIMGTSQLTLTRN